MSKTTRAGTRGGVAPVHVNKLVESQDLDGCLGYLSLVNGIDGALMFNHEGWVMAEGENTLESVRIEAPYFLANFLEILRQCRLIGMDSLEQQVAFNREKFYQVLNLGRGDRFFLVVSGTQGSFELFKFRIERGAQALVQLLHERGYLRG
jgi:hypothetical protein